MATGILNNGDYTIEDDSNGNLIVTDANDNTVLTYNDSQGQWELGTLDALSVNTDKLSHNISSGVEVSSSRSLDTEYQNTYGNTIAVIVELEIATVGTDDYNANLLAGPTSTLSASDDKWDSVGTSGGSNDNRRILQALVEDGGYYKIETFASNDATIANLWEREYA